MGLPDNYFREKNPAAIVAKVAEVTLAVISQWDERELKRVGWTNNPIIDILYSLTSAGVWIARTDTLGGGKVVDYYANQYGKNALYLANAYIGTPSDLADSTVMAYRQRKIGYKDITLAGGSAANQELVPKIATYFGVLRVLAVASNTADTYTLTFQDEDDVACVGGSGGVLVTEIAVANQPLNLAPGYVFTQASKTVNKALEVDVAGGAGVEHVLVIYEYWYEQ